MKSVYKCSVCGHEEEFFDEDLKFMKPFCRECYPPIEMDYLGAEYSSHYESANEDYFECMNDYYDGLMGI